MAKFQWWWQSDEEMAVWKKLNSLFVTPKTHQDFLNNREVFNHPEYGEICREMVYRYGNIYFFKPFPAGEPILCDNSNDVKVHGQNSSGKSYHVAGYVGYEVVGWSPYRTVQPPKYGRRIIWAFSPTFDTQRSSSQVHLFSVGVEHDIGLLPSLDVIRQNGGTVDWYRKRSQILNSVLMPDGTLIEFKSAEMGQLALSAAGVDLVWLDEDPGVKIHDEMVARDIRKEGRTIMSFLVEDAASNYVVQDLYKRYEDELKTTGKSNKSFYFMTIEDNLSLDPSKIEEKKKRMSEEGRVWRFSIGGKFVTEPKGERVVPNFRENIHVHDDLLLQYDPLRMLYRAWDLGRHRPACIGWQEDRHGCLDYLFSMIGLNIELTDFIDDVEAFCNEHMPRLYGRFEVLPHDARRKYDVSPLSAEDVFKNKKLVNRAVVYVLEDDATKVLNYELNQLKKGRPKLRFDSVHCADVIQCCNLLVRDEKTNKIKDDDYYKHFFDALKLSVAHIRKTVHDEKYPVMDESRYPLLDVGVSQVG